MTRTPGNKWIRLKCDRKQSVWRWRWCTENIQYVWYQHFRARMCSMGVVIGTPPPPAPPPPWRNQQWWKQYHPQLQKLVQQFFFWTLADAVIICCALSSLCTTEQQNILGVIKYMSSHTAIYFTVHQDAFFSPDKICEPWFRLNRSWTTRGWHF